MAVLPGPPDADGDVAELDFDRGLGFVHGDVHRGDGELPQHVLGDPHGQRLDQVQRLPRDPAPDALGHFTVVGGVQHVVGGGGAAEVQVQYGVDHERLAVAPLEIKHSVMADGGDAAQRDLVHGWSVGSVVAGGGGGRCRAGVMRAAALTASRLGPTSCTRTAQAPR